MRSGREACPANVLKNTANVLLHAGSIFTFAREQMAERWRLLRAAISRSSRFSHQPLAGRGGLDLWSGSARDPTPAYLWLRCNDRPVRLSPLHI